MKVLLILLIGIFALSIVTITYARVDDPMRPYIDSGEGYGVNPGDTPAAANQKKLEDKEKQNIADVLRGLFGINENEKFITPLPSGSLQQPTNAPGTNPTTAPNPQYTPALEANTDETQYADSVVSIIHKNCFSNPTGRTGAGIVTYVNRDCLKSLASIMNQRGIDEHYASPNNSDSSKPRYYLQCVACARGMGDARNRDYNGYGDAAQHIGKNGLSNVAGYTYYTNTPANYQHLIPGSMGVSNQNHIWYITDVKRDTTGVPIEVRAYECNFGAKGLVRHDNSYRVTSAYFTGWQKPNNL